MLQQRLEAELGRLIVNNHALAEQIEILTKEKAELTEELEKLKPKKEKKE